MGYNMGTTKLFYRHFAKHSEGGSVLLPFFDRLIRGGGFEEWRSALFETPATHGLRVSRGVPNGRGGIYLDARAVIDGIPVPMSEGNTVSEELETLLSDAVRFSLADLRGVLPDHASPNRLLDLCHLEIEALRSDLPSTPLADYSEVVSSLDQLAEAIHTLKAALDGKSVAVLGGGIKRKGPHNVNRSWIVDKYNEIENSGSDKNKTEIKNEVIDQYKEEFGLTIDEKRVREFVKESRLGSGA